MQKPSALKNCDTRHVTRADGNHRATKARDQRSVFRSPLSVFLPVVRYRRPPFLPGCPLNASARSTENWVGKPRTENERRSTRSGPRKTRCSHRAKKNAVPRMEERRRFQESQRSGLNRRPLDYESSALPLSYAGNALSCGGHALARTRTATPFGTTPSRWRVYQFHHQGPANHVSCDVQLSSYRLLEDRKDAPIRIAFTVGCPTGATGLEPATSRVTVECSNQTELRPQLQTTNTNRKDASATSTDSP